MSYSGPISPEIALTNRVMSLCYATTSVTTAWHIPLFHAAFKKEPELQNRIFCLLVSGLMDSGWEYRSRVAGISNDAKKLGSLSCDYYLNVFSDYIALAVDLLEQITRDEMVAIVELRNQWLHGNWSEIHKEMRTIKFAKGGKIEKDKVRWDKYGAIMRSNGSADDFLTPLRDRICNYRTFFWTVDRVLAGVEIQQAIMRDVMLHAHFRAPNIRITIPGPTCRPEPGTNEAFKSLNELGPVLSAKLEDRYS